MFAQICARPLMLWSFFLSYTRTGQCTSSSFAFSTVGLNYRNFVSTCAGKNIMGRAKDISTYFEHDDVYDGHDYWCVCEMLRQRNKELGMGRMYKELDF